MIGLMKLSNPLTYKFKLAQASQETVMMKMKQLTLTRPMRRKLRMRWFFDVSKVKKSSFFKSDLTVPPSDF